MNKNIELKAKYSNHELLRSLVKKLGARHVKTMAQVDTYFNVKSRTDSLSVKKGRLKLRQIDDGTAELIYYDRQDEASSRESCFLICDVSCCKGLNEFLEAVFGIKVIVEKQRELWIYEKTRIHLDSVRGLGKFVELETDATSRSFKDAQFEHDKVKTALNIDDSKLIACSYSDLIYRTRINAHLADCR